MKPINSFSLGGLLTTFKKEGGTNRIEGYACIWDVFSLPVWDSFYWVFDKGMLDGVLDLPELDCKANLEHDNDRILARWFPSKGVRTLEFTMDDIGLKFGFDVPNTTLGRDTAENVANGNYVGCSCAIRIDDMVVDGMHQGLEVYRVMKCSWLGDVCLTTDPRFPDTSVQLAKYSLSKEDFLSRFAKPTKELPDEYYQKKFQLLSIDKN